MAITYKNIIQQLKDAGITQAVLRETGILQQSTLARLKTNQPVTTETVDIICQLLHCTPNDIMEVHYNE